MSDKKVVIDKSIFDLTGKIVVITGGSRGLGRAFSEAISAFGGNVVVVARDKAKIDETLEVLAKNGKENLGIVADVTIEADINRMVDETVKKFGRLDVLFNNAGSTRKHKFIHEETNEDFDFIINTNLRSPFLVMRAVLPVMMKQNYGVIVNNSSTAGIKPFDFPHIAPVAYAGAKAAINVWTQIAALEYAKYGIRVNCIAPGIHHSDLNRGHGADFYKKLTPEEQKAKEERLQKILAYMPIARYGEAEELAGLAVLLASEASSYITGQVIAQDGGRICKH